MVDKVRWVRDKQRAKTAHNGMKSFENIIRVNFGVGEFLINIIINTLYHISRATKMPLSLFYHYFYSYLYGYYYYFLCDIFILYFILLYFIFLISTLKFIYYIYIIYITV